MTGFGDTLHAEWTKFRTVPGWVLGVLAAAAGIVAFGLLPGIGGSCGTSACPTLIGPDGTEVRDSFTFVHQPLAGDGSITVRVAALKSAVPWAKAGLIVKDGTTRGSTYAAVMVTGDHGVRLQYDYTHDIGGPAVGAPRWLRLTRAGNTVTAAESADGIRWTGVDHAQLPGLPATAEVGLFVTSPEFVAEIRQGLAAGTDSGPSRATGTFDHLTLEGGWRGAAWRSDPVGDAAAGAADGGSGLERDGDAWRVTGAGDIAPSVAGGAGVGVTVTQTLTGTFVGLILVVVVATMFVTAEYRRGLIRTTFAADPGRVRVLAAKATVLGAVTFGVGLVAAAVVVFAGRRVLRAGGVYVHPAALPTELRIVAGTAALLAVAAVMALGVGALLRRGVTAVTTAIVVIVLPYLLAVAVLSGAAASWLLRVSPAAAFALQQAARQYPQVDNSYRPADGYFPLPGWAGLAVLTGWAALAFAAAALLTSRRDA